jgi:hypothetical protein
MTFWRRAIILGVVFVGVGLIYLLVQYSHPENWDFSGVTLLIVLGVAMTFTFSILLRGSRDL